MIVQCAFTALLSLSAALVASHPLDTRHFHHFREVVTRSPSSGATTVSDPVGLFIRTKPSSSARPLPQSSGVQKKKASEPAGIRVRDEPTSSTSSKGVEVDSHGDNRDEHGQQKVGIPSTAAEAPKKSSANPLAKDVTSPSDGVVGISIRSASPRTTKVVIQPSVAKPESLRGKSPSSGLPKISTKGKERLRDSKLESSLANSASSALPKASPKGKGRQSKSKPESVRGKSDSSSLPKVSPKKKQKFIPKSRAPVTLFLRCLGPNLPCAADGSEACCDGDCALRDRREYRCVPEDSI